MIRVLEISVDNLHLIHLQIIRHNISVLILILLKITNTIINITANTLETKFVSDIEDARATNDEITIIPVILHINI